ncbi:hypothetical protein L873DRAFT_55076 [Choiromyces venosus 120613-1]|uniref:Uncharacterized protein n=1 Tax=Choiromyces venosus 120613-1 TaxID=1336337 RepID=A0A3N4J5G5_9PEZI|nr:hypothetical protein L873DRAFT_55076 [Choiromyces venosus 120613-1]
MKKKSFLFLFKNENLKILMTYYSLLLLYYALVGSCWVQWAYLIFILWIVRLFFFLLYFFYVLLHGQSLFCDVLFFFQFLYFMVLLQLIMRYVCMDGGD